MSNYSALKTDINNNIYENNTQQITGTILNTVLKDMVNTLGAGYQFAGCAYLDLNPGAPDAKVFYLAGEGLYTNFDNIQVPAGKLGILKWDTRWHLETIEGLGGGGANLTGYISVASTDNLPDVGEPTIGYLCGTNLYLYVGEGGDTKDGKYQNCGSFRGPEGVGITEIEQVEQSTENGGRNTIRIHLSNGTSYDVYTRNGTTSTGLFPTLADLQAAHPTPVVGQYAFVGAGFPADIYVCQTAGTWTDSGADYDGDNVDLTNYATKAELAQLEHEVDKLQGPFELQFIAGQYISIPAEGSTIGDPTTLASFSYSRVFATPGDTVIVRGAGGNGPRLWAFVDATGKVLSRAENGADTRNNPVVLTVPANAAELIVNINNGSIHSAVYEAQYNLEKEFAERDEKIVSVETAKVSKTPGVNIFTLENATSGKFIQSDGTLGSGSSYSVTDYLSVKPETNYFYSCGFVSNYPGASSYINFYDADRNLLSTTTSQSRSFSTPANCAFIRASIKNDYLLYAMINEGTERKEYDVFSPVGGFPKIGSRFASFVNEGEVASNATFSGDGILSNKSFFAVFQIYGTAPLDFKCGFGKGSSYGAGVRITSTEMITYSGASDSVAHTYEHGLTLSTRVRVVFSREDDDWVNITLFDDLGNSFSGRNQNSHIGVPYVTNLSENTNTVKMSQSSRDSNKPIIICGDSYWSLKDPRRIPSHLHEWGYKNYELVARSGITGTEILPYIRAIIESGAMPKYIVWAMGMNGGADVDNAVNPTWLSNTQEFISLCLNAGITPVLCTIPNVPSQIHHKLNEWVLTSKFRCVDFNASVSETGSYYWRGWGTDYALLSEDEVHPTAKGAIILAERLLLDFPEIAVL